MAQRKTWVDLQIRDDKEVAAALEQVVKQLDRASSRQGCDVADITTLLNLREQVLKVGRKYKAQDVKWGGR